MGIRELKNRLSEYLRRVKGGETIVVTERGRPVGRIVSIPATLGERVGRPVQRGILERGNLTALSAQSGQPQRQVALRSGRRGAGMILYTDAGALVKRYLQEAGTEEVPACFTRFEMSATAAPTQVEMAAVLVSVSRQGRIDAVAAQQARQDVLQHRPAYVRLPVSALSLECAARPTWKHGRRAYDALHLAWALVWQASAGEAAVFACFDRHLRRAAEGEGLSVWPEACPDPRSLKV